MHRIRYYKINEQIVWDRIKKFDILTGSEINDSVEQELNLIEGMYHFDRSTHRWILHPHKSLELDDVKIPSMNDMCLPERCQFLTWNILCDYNQSELIYTDQRYEEILKTLKSFLPDIICLQEITKDFLDLLFNEIWLKENNYYIIIMGSILNTNQNQSYGQLMLMKNFRPRAFSIYSLEDAVNSREKQYIIARFGLNLEVTIDLVNLHLHKNSIEKRCQSLEYFFQTMKTRSYMLIGDFNFGDYDIKEQNLLEKYQYQIYDLWKDIYDLDEVDFFSSSRIKYQN
jgi:endonuclease/exonuclease/phosphatase family metal-dependent hydrolase